MKIVIHETAFVLNCAGQVNRGEHWKRGWVPKHFPVLSIPCLEAQPKEAGIAVQALASEDTFPMGPCRRRLGILPSVDLLCVVGHEKVGAEFIYLLCAPYLKDHGTGLGRSKMLLLQWAFSQEISLVDMPGGQWLLAANIGCQKHLKPSPLLMGKPPTI